MHRTDRGELRLSVPAPMVFVFEYHGKVTNASTGASLAVLNGGAYHAPFLLPSRYARRLANELELA